MNRGNVYLLTATLMNTLILSIAYKLDLQLNKVTALLNRIFLSVLSICFLE
jgi:hypothetical protein